MDLNLVFHSLKELQKMAYAPYSNFQVSAIILDENNRLHFGVNVENAAYPQGVCAETSAISMMILNSGKIIKEIAILGKGNDFCTPCGGCRQKIREFAREEHTKIHLFNQNQEIKTFTLKELLPHSFGPDNLKS